MAVLPPVVGDFLHYTPAGHELVARLVQAGVKGDPASTAIGAGLTRADLASYTPTTPADWTVAPTQLRYALDELAARDAGIPATIIDAAGDLIVGTAADTAARLAVGTNGHVLTAADESLRSGWVLDLPAEEPTVTSPEPVASEVVVVDGDNLWDMSEDRLAVDLERPPTDPEVEPYWIDVMDANRDLPVEAVQFHPESLLSQDSGHGLLMIRNMIRLYGRVRR